MRRAACATALIALAMHVATAHRGDRARAEDALSPRMALDIPPSPARAPPRLALEVHTGLSMPLDNTALCPRRAGCVLRAGGGVGASLELRWPSGVGVLGGYDAWFLDSDSVYELAVQQDLRGGVRYTMPTDYVFHPIFELGAGVTGLGDTFRIATFGVLGEVFAGAEAELTETYGVRGGLGLRVFSHSPFQTKRDGVHRAEHGFFSEALFVEVALTVM